MKPFLPLLLLLLVLMPSSQAGVTPSGFANCQSVANTAGVITGGSSCITVTFSGDVERRTDRGGVAGTVSMPALGSGAVLASTITTEDALGCGTITTDLDQNNDALGAWVQFDAYALIAEGFDSCFFVIQITVIVDPTVGANVQTAAWRFLQQFAQDHPLTDQEDDSTDDGAVTIAEPTADLWLVLLIFAAIFLWGGYTRQLLVMLAGVMGILVTYTDGVPFNTTYPFLLALLVAAAIAVRNSWKLNQEDRDKADKET